VPDSVFFTGTSAFVKFSTGTWAGTGAITMALALKPFDNEALFENMLALDGNAIFLSNDNPGVFKYFNGTEVSSGLAITSASGWQLLAMTKTAGVTTPTFHRFIFGGAWSHAVGGGTTDNNGAGTVITVGNNDGGAEGIDGNILIAAVWDTALSDIQIEGLAATPGTADWIAASPKELWRFDRISAITPLIGTSTQTSSANTSLDTGDAPAGWVDGTTPLPSDYPPIGILGRGAGW